MTIRELYDFFTNAFPMSYQAGDLCYVMDRSGVNEWEIEILENNRWRYSRKISIKSGHILDFKSILSYPLSILRHEGSIYRKAKYL